MRLDGQIAWVTGGGSGIGRAIALALADAGARVAISGRRRDPLDAVAGAAPPDAIVAVPLDATDGDAVAQAQERIAAQLGRVDLLVNNAGGNVANRHLAALDPAALHRVLRVNLDAAMLCSLAVLPAMRDRQRGTLIHIGSLAAVSTFPAAGAAYAAAKAGVAQMSRYFNAEAGIHGIRSIAIHPGEVATDILDDRPHPPSAADRAAMLQPEDVAAAALFAATLPPRATIAELVITPTDNAAHRAQARAIAAG
jgi:NADP-dependent 3-hydroxy acid dehydrogenase YdfG